MRFNLEIVSPEKLTFSDAVDVVTVPTYEGEISILANHTPLVSIIQPGELRIKKGAEITYLAISGGFIQVTGHRVIILADAVERAEEIDLERAEKARERAQQMLEEKRHDQISRLDVGTMAALERALTRIKVARRRTTRGT